MVLDTFTNLQGSQTWLHIQQGSACLTPLRIYKVLKPLNTHKLCSSRLTPLRIYKVLKPAPRTVKIYGRLTPLRIYKVLKPQMVFTEPPLPGLQHKFKGFSESSTCPYQ